MSLTRTMLRLVAWLAVFLVGAPAFAQGVRDMALFAPADLSTFGGGPRANEGLFFSFDWLYWGISRPNVTKIGDPSIEPTTVFIAPNQSFDEVNSMDTGFIRGTFTEGVRTDFGAIMGHHGWLFSGFSLTPQEQTEIVRMAHVLFRDTINTGGIGYLQGYVDDAGLFTVNGQLPRLPTIFNYLKAENSTHAWGVELSYLYRHEPTYHGAIVELFAGARYMNFTDRFRVWARDAPPRGPILTEDPEDYFDPEYPDPPDAGFETTGGDDNTGAPNNSGGETSGRYNGVPEAQVTGDPINILANSYWHTTAENQMIGPQVGVRVFQKWARWQLSIDGRFFAAYNSQNFRQNGLLGSLLSPDGTIQVGLPAVMQPHTFYRQWHEAEFTPAAELRVEAVVFLTKTISLGAGWTGMYMDNIARASNVVDYVMPTMGFNMADRNQSVFMNGLNINLSVNR